jgi:hypothetical protein
MDIVIALGVVKRLRVVANRAEAASLIGLLQNGPRGVLGGINFQGVRMVGVGLLEDGITQNNLFVSRSGHRVDVQWRSRNAGVEKFNRTSKSQPTTSRAGSRFWQ